MNIPEAYELIEESRLAECNSDAYRLRHKKTGARLFILKNDDPNRVFTIGFRTPPADSTGLPHILEHSVLCGSRKYPVKDPFMALEKSSLKTFLNAMTYPDKTIYPVASCNEKDFRNLMDVYMDAVLHPEIHHQEKIFRQEGWHYELEDENGPLTVNGVVYNEMKGAFSSPDDVLESHTQRILYPDTPYANESGGDPAVIPTLSYEDFLEFHRTYYHPSNSFIYLYGDLNVEEQLVWLDEQYLGQYEAREVHSEIPRQKAFAEIRDEVVEYPIEAEEDPSGKAYLSQNWVTGDIFDPKAYAAWQILDSVLLGMPGAPVKQALTDAGIGEEILGGAQNACLQPLFTVIAKNAEEDRKEEFLRIVRETLEKEVEQGLDRKALEASLNIMEFKNREADYGYYPRGLIYGIGCFDSWLYDGDPALHLRYEDTFRFLREHLTDGYFEDLIRKGLLENTHSAVITLRPVPGLTEKRETALADKMEKLLLAMTPEEKQAMIRGTKELKAYQEEPSSPEAMATLPVLELSDISREAGPLYNTKKTAGGVPVMHHELFAGGIQYLKVLFRADLIEKEEIPWLGLLYSVLSLMPTENYSYRELSSEISLDTGGINVGLPAYQNVLKHGEYGPYIMINASALKEKMPRALELMEEILLRTDFSDTKRLKELVTENRSKLLSTLQNGGHATALLRASSYNSPVSWYIDQVMGIEFFRFLTELSETVETEEGAAETGRKLQALSEKLFRKSGMIASFTAPAEDFEEFEERFIRFTDAFPAGEATAAEDPYRPSLARWTADLSKKQEAFKTAAQIQYVALVGNYRATGHAYTGALKVLRKILADEYLWINVRVMGGAYGCMCTFGRSGGGTLVSYRDPNLGGTLAVYRGIPEYLRNLELSERDMTNYVIGAIGELDHPMSPPHKGALSFQAYMEHVSGEMRQQERDEVLAADLETIHSLAEYLEAIVACNQLCVVGNAGKIEEEKELFENICVLG